MGRIRVLRHPKRLAARVQRGALWRDRERRRALLLSLLLHLSALLVILWFYVPPRPTEPENLVMLELATPEESQAQVDAPSVDLPAPQAPLPEVAASEEGESAALLPSPPTPAETLTEMPPPEEAEAPLTEAEPVQDAPDVAQAPAPAEATPPPQPRAPMPQTPAPQAVAPPPAAQIPTPSSSDALPQLSPRPPSTTLPEIDAPQIAPQPLEDALALPAPNPQASVAPARTITAAPQVELPQAAPLPQPDVEAEVETRSLPQPQALAEVTPADALPEPDASASVVARELTPDASAEVAAAEPLPEPEASASVVTRDLPEPRASAEVGPTEPLPSPDVAASVVSREVPEPQASAAVSESAPLPEPSAVVSVVPLSPVPQPPVEASLPSERPLAAEPAVQLSEAVPLALPEVGVSVTPTLPTPAPSAEAELPADGSAASTAQAQADEDAQLGAAGAASSPDGSEEGSASTPQPFNATLERPLAVLLDNAEAAYPQQGLQEATAIYEMPVEGGLTRLMSIYTQGEPAQVGPIRSARDYFLEAALRMNGTLVHVGGAPSTVGLIASQDIPTLDAFTSGSLFSQAPDREMPHNTFAAGTALREAVGRLGGRTASGLTFRPAEDAADAAEVTVDVSAVYSSGFRYLSEVDQYRWLRNGSEAIGAEGTPVVVDAVVVARVPVVPLGDREGRLYIPYDAGGEATLYVRGKAVAGRWNPVGGFQFVTERGEVVDLTPFRHWIVFAPEGVEVTFQ